MGWHGPGDYELKDKNGSKSGSAPGGREATSSPSQTTRPQPAWMKGGGSQGLTLTDFAIDSHLQLQALVFLMVDRFGDVVVAVSFLELLAQGERCEALEFLRQLLWAMLGTGLVALPSDLVLGLGLTRHILLVFHHVQCVSLHGSICHRVVLIMWADDV